MASRLQRMLKENCDGLILVFGPSGSGKTTLFLKWAKQYGFPYKTIGSLVSERMIGSSNAERSDVAQRVFLQVIDSANGDVVLCDNLELLFASDLCLDPLRLLKQAARSKTIIATWNGYGDGITLSYSMPGHNEYRTYSRADIANVSLYSVNEANAL